MPDRARPGEGLLSASDGTAASFLADAFDAFETAVSRAGRVDERVGVAGRCAQVSFAGEAMHSRIAPALIRESAPGAEPSLDVAVFDSASTGTAMPRPPWGPDDVRERGEVRGFQTASIRCAYNAGSGVLTLWDRSSGRALVWARAADEVPYYETASPLRTLWAWWLADIGMQVVHAAAVGEAGRGVLLTGKGGSGKTTTSLLCVADGMAYGGDNNLVLEPTDAPRGHALFTSATVRPDTLDRLPALRDRLENPDRLDVEKGLLFVDAEPHVDVLRSFDIACVLLPEVVDATRSRLVPASAGACLAALAPSSIFSVPFARAEAFRAMAGFARAVPTYHLYLAGDLPAVAPLVRRALEGALP